MGFANEAQRILFSGGSLGDPSGGAATPPTGSTDKAGNFVPAGFNDIGSFNQRIFGNPAGTGNPNVDLRSGNPFGPLAPPAAPAPAPAPAKAPDVNINVGGEGTNTTSTQGNFGGQTATQLMSAINATAGHPAQAQFIQQAQGTDGGATFNREMRAAGFAPQQRPDGSFAYVPIQSAPAAQQQLAGVESDVGKSVGSPQNMQELVTAMLSQLFNGGGQAPTVLPNSRDVAPDLLDSLRSAFLSARGVRGL